jgi:hypothetical protein
VAQIQGKPVYTIANVAVIPISSHADASHAISQAKESLLQGGEDSDDTDTSSEATDVSDTETEDGEVDVSTAPTSPVRERPHTRTDSISSNVTETVMGKRPRFGRFAANWLSRKAMGLPGLGTAELNPDTPDTPLVEMKKDDTTSNVAARSASAANEDEPAAEANDGVPPKEQVELPATTKPIELLPKLLRYTKLIFSSRNFFFSYDYDLTRSVSAQPSAPNVHLPLHKVADELVGRHPPPFRNTLLVTNSCSSSSGTRISWSLL